MRHQGANIPGMGGDEGERGDRASTAGEEVDLSTESGDQCMQIGGLQAGVVLQAAVAAGALAQATRVVGDHSPLRKLPGQVGEAL